MTTPASIENVVIIGTGCAGLTAAVYTARAGLAPLVLEGTQPGGQLTTTSEVENFPGFEHGIDGYTLTDTPASRPPASAPAMRAASSSPSIFPGPVKVLRTGEREIAPTPDHRHRRRSEDIGLPEEMSFFGGKGVTTCATCDGAFYRKMDVIVVGGGDSAAEEALFLTRFASKVTLVHRRDALRASKIMQQRVLEHPKIKMAWDSVVAAISGDAQGNVAGVKLKNVKTGALSEVPCKGIFVAIGHQPNTKPFVGALHTDEAGYIVPERGSQVRTGVEGVFVAGDCADHLYRQAITAAGMGCQAAIETERWLAEHGA
jgi:thioredoxin reductase (NADPH)